MENAILKINAPITMPFSKPQPRIIILRNASAVHVVGKHHETGCSQFGNASTGQIIPERSRVRNMNGMLSWIAWNSDVAMADVSMPMHIAAQPKNRASKNTVIGFPSKGMSNP